MLYAHQFSRLVHFPFNVRWRFGKLCPGSPVVPFAVIRLSIESRIIARLDTSAAMWAMSSCLAPYMLSVSLLGADIPLSSVDASDFRDEGGP